MGLRPAAVIMVAIAFYLLASPSVFYLVLDEQFAARWEARRMPEYFDLSGREVECELRAAELRKMPLTPGARCEAVPLWRHWWNEMSAAD